MLPYEGSLPIPGKLYKLNKAVWFNKKWYPVDSIFLCLRESKLDYLNDYVWFEYTFSCNNEYCIVQCRIDNAEMYFYDLLRNVDNK